MKTIKQWLETLPEPYRGQALANLEKEESDHIVSSDCEAVNWAFNWGESPEGFEHWYAVYRHLKHGDPLPVLAVDDTQTVLSEVIKNLQDKGDEWNANILTSLAERLKN